MTRVVYLEDTDKTPAHYFLTTSRIRYETSVSSFLNCYIESAVSTNNTLDLHATALPIHSLTRESVSLLCLSDQQSSSSWVQKFRGRSVPMKIPHFQSPDLEFRTHVWCPFCTCAMTRKRLHWYVVQEDTTRQEQQPPQVQFSLPLSLCPS